MVRWMEEGLSLKVVPMASLMPHQVDRKLWRWSRSRILNRNYLFATRLIEVFLWNHMKVIVYGEK
jgi:hypothetical protein